MSDNEKLQKLLAKHHKLVREIDKLKVKMIMSEPRDREDEYWELVCENQGMDRHDLEAPEPIGLPLVK